MSSLLPLNSTPLELAVEAANYENTLIPLRSLYNADTCPEHLLPYLASAWSVDRWNNTWTQEAKRTAIRSAYDVHARKGTIGALRRVVEPLGYLIDVVEWFDTMPEGVPGTFALEVGLNDAGITEELYEELAWLIDDARPVSRHMTNLALSLQTEGVLGIAVCVYEGEEIDVYPPAPQDIDVTGSFGPALCVDETDTLDVYPYD
ncbi:phage tail protein [Pseudomonas sp. Root68]|uniref:phage tail protein I n=1 Tax=unclassified Pseudomonas TaxID=196821 RepID=UPI0006FF44E0|nr:MULTISPECIES: phage tail protein I [unclassified Pseudomonas]KRA95870.1 phage tail protein [Pseudomonas sp. Root68]KRB66454.1 phage tail protein [Pseudomonas sp. Root71]